MANKKYLYGGIILMIIGYWATTYSETDGWYTTYPYMGIGLIAVSVAGLLLAIYGYQWFFGMVGKSMAQGAREVNAIPNQPYPPQQYAQQPNAQQQYPPQYYATPPVEQPPVAPQPATKQDVPIIEYDICLECDEKYPVNSKFCPECGTKVKKENICSECGNVSGLKDKFCSECGNKMI